MVQREIADRLRAAPGLADLRSPERARPARLRGRAAADGRPGGVQAPAAGGLGAARASSATRPRRRPASRAAWCATRSRTGASRWRARSSCARRAVAGVGRARRSRDLGLAEDARAEALAPAEFVGARGGAGGPLTLARRRSSTSASTSGAARADGLHELRSLFCPLTLADRIVIERAPARPTRWSAPGSRARTWPPSRSTALRARGWTSPPVRVEIEKRIPVAAGLGGGSADAAAVLRLARTRSTTSRRWPPGSAPTSPRSSTRACALVCGAGEVVEPLPAPGEFGVVLIAGRGRPRHRRRLRARPTALGLGREPAELDRARRASCARQRRAAPRRSPTPSCWSTTSSRRRVSLRPEIGEALDGAARRRGPGGAGHRLGPDRVSGCSTTSSPPTRRRPRCRPATRTRSSPRRERARMIPPCDWAAIRRRRGERIRLLALIAVFGRRLHRLSAAGCPNIDLERLPRGPRRRARELDLRRWSACSPSSRPAPSSGSCFPARRW